MAETIHFSESTLRVLPFPAKGRTEYRDDTDRHLRLRVSSTGRMTWYHVQWHRGRVEWVTLGTHPALRVAEAREESRRTAGRFATGESTTRKPRIDRVTFGVVWSRWVAEYAAKYRRDVDECRRRHDLHFATLDHTRLPGVSRGVLSRLHTRIGENAGRYEANRCLELIRAAFNWAMEEGLTAENPARGVRLYPERSRERFLDADEIARFLAALNAEKSAQVRDFLMLCLLTGARRGNIQAMRWDQIHWARNEWRIPGAVTKNGEALTIPLPGAAMEILGRRRAANESDRVVRGKVVPARRSEWVFPARVRGSRTGHMVDPSRVWRRVRERAGLEDVRIHDLRRTLGSWMVAQGVSLEVIGKQLGHKSLAATKVYARLNLDPLRAAVEIATGAMLDAGVVDTDGDEDGRKKAPPR